MREGGRRQKARGRCAYLQFLQPVFTLGLLARLGFCLSLATELVSRLDEEAEPLALASALVGAIGSRGMICCEQNVAEAVRSCHERLDE